MHDVEQWAQTNGATLVTLDTYIDSPLSVLCLFVTVSHGYSRPSDLGALY